MNKAATHFRREVRRCLHCGRAAKRRLEEHLTGLLNAFLEENPAPDRAALEDAFGAPEELAATLMEELTPQERSQWKRQRLAVRVVLVALAALLAMFSVYTFFCKERPVELTTYEFSYISGGTDGSTSPADKSGE
ncbi:MAG: hypothetical protein LIO95_10650 [Clostridiales bacterium]|nr:hypothetical protein [Clostridiales bacterium]